MKINVVIQESRLIYQRFHFFKYSADDQSGKIYAAFVDTVDTEFKKTVILF